MSNNFKKLTYVSIRLTLIVSFAWINLAWAAEEVPPLNIDGNCGCSAKSGVFDDSSCTSCSNPAQCSTKECLVLVNERGQYRLVNYPCEWEPEQDKCGTCRTPNGFITVIKCPTEADQGHCGDFSCINVKIGYNGPLTPTLNGRRNPNVQVNECEKS
ncbi:hypothetical protein OAO01_01560 [Oligoflexia bacterium]|nr:hypothetical protein [Oligoflexia bacterium]